MKKKSPSVDFESIEEYIDNGFKLLLLHRYDAVDDEGKEAGKRPIGRTWTIVSRKEAKAHADNNKNLGAILTESDLVIDVDQRNYKSGEDSLQKFLLDSGLSLKGVPMVRTGSNGWHYYFKKPGDLRLPEKLADYPGLEFKSKGRYMVTAGSIHPCGKSYVWAEGSPSLEDTPLLPKDVLSLLQGAISKKKKREALPGASAPYTPKQLKQMLNLLDPEDFRDHDDWFSLMAASHHAVGGQGGEIFATWSIQDPEYADQYKKILSRWKTLTEDGSDAGVKTYRHLHEVLEAKGFGDKILRPSAAADFMEQDDHVTSMNERFCVVNENGKFRIFEECLDYSFDPPRTYWLRYADRDFRMLYAHPEIQLGNKKVSIADAWMFSPNRRQYDGIIFNPKPQAGRAKLLNLWRGWAVEPKAGSWELLKHLIQENLCDGDEEAFEYVMDWMANMFQNPAQPAEVAICFQGDKGTGKSTLGRALADITGRHGLHVSSPEHLTGRFNAHLRDCIFLFADEAITPYDKSANSRLKALITEHTIAIEGKGQDLVTVKNTVHIMMASNDDWFVPMSLADERRFFVSRVNSKRKNDKNFFEKLHKQMANGGLAAMLHELLNRDIEGWHPRNSIPVTDASMEQKIRSLPPVGQWWFNILAIGELPFLDCDDWDLGSVRVFCEEVQEHFHFWCKGSGITPSGGGRSNMDFFVRELRKLCGPDFKSNARKKVPRDRNDITPFKDGRARCYRFPSLTECRDHMDKLLGGKYSWSD
jgi:hypothetical protein